MQSVREIYDMRLGSSQAMLRALTRMACLRRGLLRLDITTRDRKAGCSAVIWTREQKLIPVRGYSPDGEVGDSFSLMDGPDPINALVDILAAPGASLMAEDDVYGYLGNGVARMELVGITVFSRGESAKVRFTGPEF